MSAPARFEFLDAVTSDLTFLARAPSLDAVFAAAAEALLAATLEASEPLAPRERRRVACEARDLELLLLAFLNELVYLRDAEGLLLRPERVRVEQGEERPRLVADLVGEPLRMHRDALAAEVKAATAHGLRVERTSEGWEAQVTLDV